MTLEPEETICFFGYPEQQPDGSRLDEFSKIEVEDIMRAACAVHGKPFSQKTFDEYWSEAQARKRCLFMTLN
jgi:hypothetical protein